MTDVSEARQAIRDYARQPINLVTVDEENQKLKVTTGKLGEVAGLTFEALQGVLEVCDSVRSGRTVRSALGIVNLIEQAIERPFTR